MKSKNTLVIAVTAILLGLLGLGNGVGGSSPTTATTTQHITAATGSSQPFEDCPESDSPAGSCWGAGGHPLG
jgi:hypothetical protein